MPAACSRPSAVRDAAARAPANLARSLALVAGLAFAGCAFAAPDEDMLGKAEGYPVCPPSLVVEPRCLIGYVSRRDETADAHTVFAGDVARPLQRAPAEPAFRYAHQTTTGGLDEFLARNRTTGLLILKGDTILAERYQYDRTPEHRMSSFSMGKTVVAMLVGIALAEGSIKSIDDRAEKYVPELKGTPFGATSIRHLLTMSSGIKFSETYSGTDDVATLVRLSLLGESDGGAATVMPFRTRERPPGAQYKYSSADSQVLGLVVRGATGRTLADYLSQKIWQPMGAEADASWLIDRGGYEIGYAGINATLRDYARFGMLLANDGALDGKQIIPARWVRAATTPSAKQFEPSHTGMIFGYGYQTWLLGGKERQFMLRGLRNQVILVDPKSKLVLVHTAAGNLSDGGFGEVLSLWNGVQKSLAK